VTSQAHPAELTPGQRMRVTALGLLRALATMAALTALCYRHSGRGGAQDPKPRWKRYGVPRAAAGARCSLLLLSPLLSIAFDGARGVSWMSSGQQPFDPGQPLVEAVTTASVSSPVAMMKHAVIRPWVVTG